MDVSIEMQKWKLTILSDSSTMLLVVASIRNGTFKKPRIRLW